MIQLDDVTVYDAIEATPYYDLILKAPLEKKAGTGGNRGTKKKKPDYKKLAHLLFERRFVNGKQGRAQKLLHDCGSDFHKR